MDAMHFGLTMPGDGYNVFLLGPTGVGKLTAAREMVSRLAQGGAPPPDWCYVFNFARPHQPNAIRLPAGMGAKLRTDMQQFVEDLQIAIPAAFESEDYRARVEDIEQSVADRQRKMFEQTAEQARSRQLLLMHTPAGFAFAPIKKGDEVLPQEEFAALPEGERNRIEAEIRTMQQTLQKAVRQLPQWAKEASERIKEINREIAKNAVDHLIASLTTHYGHVPELSEYLGAVASDVIDNVMAFMPQQPGNPMAMFARLQTNEALLRYQVNLLVDNSALTQAPVVYEDLPSYANLIGRSEYRAQMGTLMTDFTLIKAGALHRANGGYLVLDARQVLQQPLAWDALKRALKAHEVRLDSLERSVSLISTVSLEPEHIPIKVKVVLIGDRSLYYLLSQYDPDFADLFKVMADFDDTMLRETGADRLYAGLFATLGRLHGLLPMAAAGVATMIEHAGRLAQDARKLSTNLRDLTDLLREANHWATRENATVIGAPHVQQAIDQHAYRSKRVQESHYESIRRGTILIATEGAKVGQVNGLSVLQLGKYRFGWPTRITATTRLGEGKVIDIEREAELGGPLHSKGVLILSNFLASRYAKHQPLSISASIVFEQSYGMVEGDSASLAELCALLSSLSRLPIDQRFAVTGSVNQHGDIQPIGAVNEKIEGFFDVCNERGLTGDQGVLIPGANIEHLMLRDEVVQAVRDGRFAVYAINSVDEAICLLTGVEAGVMTAGGSRPVAETVNGRVAARLGELSKKRRRFASTESKAGRA
ncbi:MAG: AAA family ATPase [Burkholderiaceae bacterium]